MDIFINPILRDLMLEFITKIKLFLKIKLDIISKIKISTNCYKKNDFFYE